MSKQMSSDSFKNEISNKFISYMSCVSIPICVKKWLMLICDCYIAILEII